MAMKYQRGTVYPSGQKVKMWYGKYLVYRTNQEGKEVRSQRNIAICPKAKTPKWKAQQLLQQIIMNEGGGNGVTSKLLPDDSVTFSWFVKQRYIPKREGKWSPAYKKSNAYELEHYLCSRFGNQPLRSLDAFEIQIWLNQLAKKGYSEAVVGHCFTNIRAITRLARKLKFLSEDPAEDLTKPQTEPIERPVMTRGQIALLLRAINDMHDLCLLYVGIFCGTRTSEVMGMQWKSWNGESLTPHGTAFEGKLYPGRLKTKQSKAPIPVPKLVRPVIENWRRQCADSSPDALMFPTFGRGKRKGQAVPRWGKNFLTGRIRPIARKLGMADRLITFQVMRRTLGTDMQNFGSLKDIQSMLRHGSSVTTNDIYVQPIDENVQQAADLRTAAVLNGWKAPVQSMGVGGRNVKGISAIRRSSAKPGKEVLVTC